MPLHPLQIIIIIYNACSPAEKESKLSHSIKADGKLFQSLIDHVWVETLLIRISICIWQNITGWVIKPGGSSH